MPRNKPPSNFDPDASGFRGAPICNSKAYPLTELEFDACGSVPPLGSRSRRGLSYPESITWAESYTGYRVHVTYIDITNQIELEADVDNCVPFWCVDLARFYCITSPVPPPPTEPPWWCIESG